MPFTTLNFDCTELQRINKTTDVIHPDPANTCETNSTTREPSAHASGCNGHAPYQSPDNQIITSSSFSTQTPLIQLERPDNISSMCPQPTKRKYSNENPSSSTSAACIGANIGSMHDSNDVCIMPTAAKYIKQRTEIDQAQEKITRHHALHTTERENHEHIMHQQAKQQIKQHPTWRVQSAGALCKRQERLNLKCGATSGKTTEYEQPTTPIFVARKRKQQITERQHLSEQNLTRRRCGMYLTYDEYGNPTPMMRALINISRKRDPIELGYQRIFALSFSHSLDACFSSPVQLSNGLSDTNVKTQLVSDDAVIFYLGWPKISDDMANGNIVRNALQKLEILKKQYGEQLSAGAISMIANLHQLVDKIHSCFFGRDRYGDLRFYIFKTDDKIFSMRSEAINFLLALEYVSQFKKNKELRLKATHAIDFEVPLNYFPCLENTFNPYQIECIVPLNNTSSAK